MKWYATEKCTVVADLTTASFTVAARLRLGAAEFSSPKK